jgi:hypothetical protein
MPVNYVQALQDSADDAVEKLRNNQPQPRGTSLKIYHPGPRYEIVNFYPLQPRGTSGFNFVVYPRDHFLFWGMGSGHVVHAGARLLVGEKFEKLLSIKSHRLTNLAPIKSRQANLTPAYSDDRPEPTNSSCVIM